MPDRAAVAAKSNCRALSLLDGLMWFAPYPLPVPDERGIRVVHLCGLDSPPVARGSGVPPGALVIWFGAPALSVDEVGDLDFLRGGGYSLRLSVGTDDLLAPAVPSRRPVVVRGRPGHEWSTRLNGSDDHFCMLEWHEPAPDGQFVRAWALGPLDACGGALLAFAEALEVRTAPSGS